MRSTCSLYWFLWLFLSSLYCDIVQHHEHVILFTGYNTIKELWVLLLILQSQEICESHHGCPGLPVLNNSPYGLCGRTATLTLHLNYYSLKLYTPNDTWFHFEGWPHLLQLIMPKVKDVQFGERGYRVRQWGDGVLTQGQSLERHQAAHLRWQWAQSVAVEIQLHQLV